MGVDQVLGRGPWVAIKLGVVSFDAHQGLGFSEMAGLQGGFLAARLSPPPAGTRRVAAIRAPVAKLAVEQGRVSSKFAQLRDSGKAALIPYITAGDPSLALTAQAIRLLDSRGADIIELGVPYSDPLADGPVIQAAASRALERGTTLDSVLSMVHEVAPTTRAPLVLFTYFNPILKRGIENFCKQVKAAGAAGLVVPDVPLEETGTLRKYSEANGIELVLLTTPTTPKERMKEISESSQGFIYLVSLTGVTGARSSVDARVQDLLKDIKEVTDKPVAVGFGVSGAEQAAQIAKWGADGVIVGSAVVKILAESQNGDFSQLDAFISELKSVL